MDEIKKELQNLVQLLDETKLKLEEVQKENLEMKAKLKEIDDKVEIDKSSIKPEYKSMAAKLVLEYGSLERVKEEIPQLFAITMGDKE